ncbi:UNVERIFIED_CONTAM: hypothetical protein RMT77_009357 [Armadillidium vulgare]
MNMFNFIYEKVLATSCLVICIFSIEVLGNNDAVKNCACGPNNNQQSRIMGGIEAEENEFPWLAAMYYMENLICSASLINNFYLITAAHCFNMFRLKNDTSIIDIRNITVVLGLHQREIFSEYKDVRPIIKLIIPEKYVCTNESHDLALIKMKEPVTRYTTKISPICLPPSGPKFENVSAIVSGWGWKHDKGKLVKNLRKTNVKILPNFQCYTKISKLFEEDIMMCANSFEKKTCKGDSGGPLIIINRSDKYVQIGVVSFGFGCYANFFPDVFTRVNHYLPWIKNHTRDATYCEN